MSPARQRLWHPSRMPYQALSHKTGLLLTIVDTHFHHVEVAATVTSSMRQTRRTCRRSSVLQCSLSSLRAFVPTALNASDVPDVKLNLVQEA
jgi:hypothetical protein